MKEAIQFLIAISSFQMVASVLHILVMDMLDKPCKFWHNLIVIWFAGWLLNVIIKGGV